MAKNNGGETIIARGVRIEGDFFAEGDIIIEGEVRGIIATSGDLRVGEEAKIDANIKAQNAVIAGNVQGNMRIEEKLELLASSEVSGDVTVQVLSVEAGAQVNGVVHMGEEAQKAKKKNGASEEA
jgi:cytoskeletal protein CcmA (bactofilin family)